MFECVLCSGKQTILHRTIVESGIMSYTTQLPLVSLMIKDFALDRFITGSLDPVAPLDTSQRRNE